MTNSFPFPLLCIVGLLPLLALCTYVGKMCPWGSFEAPLTPKVQHNNRKPNNQRNLYMWKGPWEFSLTPLPPQVRGEGTQEMLETSSSVITLKECFLKVFCFVFNVFQEPSFASQQSYEGFLLLLFYG